jgi:7-cyano-7-deazaguanine synthase
LSTDKSVEVYTPLIDMDKIEIVQEGLDLEVPYHLTRTCYKDQERSCGVCGSCVERLEAFKLNNVKDPIEYE